MMCPPDHKHDRSLACYQHGCRCEPCVTNRRAANRAIYQRRKGEPRFTTRDEIRQLTSYGFGPALIAEMFGMKVSDVRKVTT